MDFDLLEALAEDIYKTLGRFHPKIIYVNALELEFLKRKIPFVKNRSFPLLYNDQMLGNFMFDFIIDSIPIDVIVANDIDVEYIELFKNRMRNIKTNEGYIICFVRKNAEKYIIVSRIKLDLS